MVDVASMVVGWLWTAVLVIVGMVVLAGLSAFGAWVYVKISYPYKCSYRPVFGDVGTWKETGVITLGKRHKKSIGPCKNGSEWRAFMFKKHFPPIPRDAILAGKEVDCYLLPDGMFIPATHDIRKDGELITQHMNAVLPEAKSWAINDLQAIAKRYDPRSQGEIIKGILGLIGIALVGLGIIIVGAYAGYKMYTYGADKGATSAQEGAQVCGKLIANEIGGIVRGQNISSSPQVLQPKQVLPFGAGGT